MLLLPVEAEAKRLRKKSRKAPPVRELVVTPSPEFDSRVAEETARALFILQNPESGALLASPYAVSAVYYREGFLSSFPDSKPDAHPARRVIAQLSRVLTPDLRMRIVRTLSGMYESDLEAIPDAFILPIAGETSARRRRRTHQNALDVFASEGSEVRSMTRGVVVLADRNWTEADPFSTSSAKCGNSVIVFDLQVMRFYRYCHLDDVYVVLGTFVAPGQAIGTVGHSGWNASRPGHGRHLHLEVSDVERGGAIRPLRQDELLRMLRDAETIGPQLPLFAEAEAPCSTELLSLEPLAVPIR